MAIFNVSITEAGAATAVQTVGAVFVRTRSESISATASAVLISRVFGATKQDLAPATAFQAVSVDYVVSVTETLSAAEMQAVNEKAAFQSEAISAVESSDAGRVLARSVTEYLHPSDFVTGELDSGKDVSEIVYAADASVATVVPPEIVAEAVSATDECSADRTINRSVSEALTATEISHCGEIDEEVVESLGAATIQSATLTKITHRVTTRQFLRSSRRRATASAR